MPEPQKQNGSIEWIKALTYNPLVIIVVILLGIFNLSSKMDMLSSALEANHRATSDLSEKLDRVRRNTEEIKREVKDK